MYIILNANQNIESSLFSNCYFDVLFSLNIILCICTWIYITPRDKAWILLSNTWDIFLSSWSWFPPLPSIPILSFVSLSSFFLLFLSFSDLQLKSSSPTSLYWFLSFDLWYSGNTSCFWEVTRGYHSLGMDFGKLIIG